MLEMGMALRLKGFATAEGVAEFTGASVEDAAAALATMVDAGHATESPRGHRLSPEGKAWTDELLATEREGIDAPAVDVNYERFCEHNATFKQLVTDWQMLDPETLNDHEDAGYDASVLARLDELHDAVGPVFGEAATLCPRLTGYVGKFEAALAEIRGGDHSWLASPMKASYHTVWFEFHEELILLSGRNRADEAAAGRGA